MSVKKHKGRELKCQRSSPSKSTKDSVQNKKVRCSLKKKPSFKPPCVSNEVRALASWIKPQTGSRRANRYQINEKEKSNDIKVGINLTEDAVDHIGDPKKSSVEVSGATKGSLADKKARPSSRKGRNELLSLETWDDLQRKNRSKRSAKGTRAVVEKRSKLKTTLQPKESKKHLPEAQKTRANTDTKTQTSEAPEKSRICSNKEILSLASWMNPVVGPRRRSRSGGRCSDEESDFGASGKTKESTSKNGKKCAKQITSLVSPVQQQKLTPGQVVEHVTSETEDGKIPKRRRLASKSSDAGLTHSKQKLDSTNTSKSLSKRSVNRELQALADWTIFDPHPSSRRVRRRYDCDRVYIAPTEISKQEKVTNARDKVPVSAIDSDWAETGDDVDGFTLVCPQQGRKRRFSVANSCLQPPPQKNCSHDLDAFGMIDSKRCMEAVLHRTKSPTKRRRLGDDIETRRQAAEITAGETELRFQAANPPSTASDYPEAKKSSRKACSITNISTSSLEKLKL